MLTPPLGAHPRRERVLGGALVQGAVARRAVLMSVARARPRARDLAEGPAHEVDGVRAPRADPATAALGVEQPAVLAQRDAGAGAEVRPLRRARPCRPRPCCTSSRSGHVPGW